MPKNKPVSRPGKRQTPQAKPPETADEYLALGVENEEAGEKWRAGDASKSARFFVRALETYEKGLQTYPRSFDLAYNKARIQYQITQYPALCAEFPGTPKEMLQIALESHEKVMQLDGENANVLFNTAQVMTSLAEAIDDDGRSTQSQQPAQLVQEAIGLFQRCLGVQELLYNQTQAQMSMPFEDIPESALVTEVQGSERDETGSRDVQEQWASILEPVTKATLVETALGLLDALTTLCSVSNTFNISPLSTIETLAQPLLEVKLPCYLDGMTEEAAGEVLESKARFAAGLAELRYRTGAFDVLSYDKALKQIFDDYVINPQATRSPEMLLAYADAILAFNTAIFRENGRAVVRWTRLTKVLECLAQATKLLSPMNTDGFVSINSSRGDTELLRLGLCALPDMPGNISNSQVQMTLLKNARAYYRGAADLLRSSTQTAARRRLVVMSIKEALTSCLQEQNSGPLLELRKRGVQESAMKPVVVDMVEDLLLSRETLAKCDLSDLIMDA